jgi:hypothetical protein
MYSLSEFCGWELQLLPLCVYLQCCLLVLPFPHLTPLAFRTQPVTLHQQAAVSRRSVRFGTRRIPPLCIQPCECTVLYIYIQQYVCLCPRISLLHLINSESFAVLEIWNVISFVKRVDEIQTFSFHTPLSEVDIKIKLDLCLVKDTTWRYIGESGYSCTQF